MAGVLKHTMVLRNPETLEATALLAGSELPKWATDIVHEDNLEGASSKSDKDDTDPYAGMDAKALAKLVDERNADRDDDNVITVTGTGKDGNVLKGDLLTALQTDDKSAAGSDS